MGDYRAQEHPWCPRCGVIDGPLVDGNCDVCLSEDGVTEAVEFVVWAIDHRGAVEARTREIADWIRGGGIDAAVRIHPENVADAIERHFLER